MMDPLLLTEAPSKSSTLVPVEREAPTVKRLKAVMAEMQTFIAKSGNGKQRRMNLIMKHMSRAVIEELEDIPQEHIGFYFAQFGEIVSWIGTGDDSSLPDGIREFLMARMGTLPPEAYEEAEPLPELPEAVMTEP
jgi:hypothetical protein